ncbi:MAG: DNA polymerase Y family protein [Myxococcaceae bacterium]|nr:DNA polymerase Y family protein [Myxococcaceae bacterium]
MRRVLALFFPDLLVELIKTLKIRTNGFDRPWVVFLQTENLHCKVPGRYARINAASSGARALNIMPGHTLTSARAKLRRLDIVKFPEARLRLELTRIADQALALAPCVGFEAARSIMWVEIGDCSHLYRSEEDPTGESTFLKRLSQLLAPLRHHMRMAVADGPRLAAAAAMYGPEKQWVHIVPQGQAAAAFGQLSILAWGLSDETQERLNNFGVSKIKQLQTLPIQDLRDRLQPDEWPLLPLLEGKDDGVFEPYRPVTWPEERLDFDDEIIHTEALLFAAQRMVQSLSTRLSARALGVTRLRAELSLHRSLARENPKHVWWLSFSAPAYRFDALFSVVRTSIEQLNLVAPAVGFTLAVVEAAPVSRHTLDLFLRESRAERLLPQWWAECAAALGRENVGTLEIVDTWNPEERTRLVPWSAEGFRSPRSVGKPLPVPEPVRWLKTPIPYEGPMTHEPVLLRSHSVEWWKTPDRFRQWRLVWVFWAQASAWVEEGNGQCWIRGWVDV